MGLFDWIFGSNDTIPDGRYIHDGPHWELVGLDLYRIFRAIPILVPKGSLLGLEGGSIPPHLDEFLTSNHVELPPEIATARDREFEGFVFIPIDPPLMAQLEQHADHCAEPEIAVNIVVVHHGEKLFQWHDLGSKDPAAVSPSIREEEVTRFSTEAGGRFKWSPDPV